ncbi:MAG: lipoate--protein ligase [Firmicutes bacterium]|nr:lipoate--protein ligase [Bacillota bacterium]
MIYVDSKGLDPYFNLALEEYLLTKTDKDIFMLWRNDNTIVVGKNQNTAAEINTEYVKKSNINVVRRLTGGGAVFHDKGNLNFSFLLNNDGRWFSDFEKFTSPIINVLQSLGVDARGSGRNDILVDGCKISGNAQTVHKNRILHHGTLLFSSDISKIANALNVNEAKISSKGIKSVKSRVTNISKYLKDQITVLQFKELLAKSFGLEQYVLAEQDIANINRLADEKYRSWEWNYGYSPRYAFKNNMRFSGGCIEINLDIKNGLIQDCKIFGDFFSSKNISDIENALKGVKHNPDGIKTALREFAFNKYFLGITLEEFLEAVC